MNEGVVFSVKIPRTSTVLKGSIRWYVGLRLYIKATGAIAGARKMAVGLVGSQLTINSGFSY
jgi:hypothetical protein